MGLCNLEMLNRIADSENWFLFDEECCKENNLPYPVCYRYAVTYSLFGYLSRGHSADEGETALRELDTALGKEDFAKEDFVEVFHFNGGKGYVIVDQSNGCIPLILYSRKDRTTAYEVSVKEALRHIKALLDCYQRTFSTPGSFPQRWTEGFQAQLREIFFPSSKRRVA